MRRFRCFAVLSVAGMMFASATQQVMSETPRRGGTLVFAITLGEPDNYDCHGSVSSAVLQRVAPHYSLLVKIDPANYPTVVADLAESWTVTQDGLVYSFNLRHDVHFHDGSLLTAKDIKATLDRIRQPPPGVVSARQAIYRDIAAVETPDESTVVVRLAKPNASMLLALASPWNCVYSAAMLAKDPKYPEHNVMGTGPFRFVEHVAGSEWRGERFEGYFRKDLPYLDGFRAINVAPASLATLLAGGQVQIDFNGVTRVERDRIAAVRGDKTVFKEVESTNVLSIAINTTKPPFDDDRVRRALNLAIDRKAGHRVLENLNVFNGLGAFVRSGSEFGASPDVLKTYPGFGDDVAASRAEAKRLLQEAGVTNLNAVFLNRPSYSSMGVFLIDQWRQIGVTVTQELPENQRFFSLQRAGQFDLTITSAINFVDDPTLQLAHYQSYDRNPQNLSRAIDRTFDALYDRQSETLDPTIRLRLVRETERYLLDKVYGIPTFWARRHVPMAAEIRGYVAPPSFFVGQDLAEVWLADPAKAAPQR